MWFLETAWPPIIVLLVLSAVFLNKWKETGKKSMLITAVVMILCTPLIYIVEFQVVTEKEVLEQNVMDFTTNFQQKNLEQTLSFIHKKNRSDEFRVKNAFKVLEVKDDLRVTDLRVKLFDNGTSGITHFRANGSVQFKGQDMGHHPSRWNVYWKKTDEGWKVIQVDRLDPINGNVIRIPISSYTGIRQNDVHRNEDEDKIRFGSRLKFKSAVPDKKID